ncbi:MAG TPA: 2-C-methyl-D-erythritol 2,4-cyclodiphosphate synthase [Bacteroidetes bacterium]|nr:2-C-methyl-D-erythritol 2,4-cyclodiphosphate synthase [Bacteroidota bacterium]
MILRIGFGYDVHPLVPDRELMIGGISIPHYKGTKGHSDGDALIHAIVDALLGTLALGNIGDFFPDNDPAYHNMKSRIFLEKTIALISNQGFYIVNIDSTVVLEQPKIKSYIPAIRKSLSEIMQIPIDAVSVKATTSEKMGFIGKEEGIACYAVVLIQKY